MSPMIRNDVAALKVFLPRTLPEALRMLRDEGPLLVLAGCTDLFVHWNDRVPKHKACLDLSALGPLRKIETRRDHLRIGALASYMQIQRDAAVAAWVPMLIAASQEIGGIQIQERGTLGGNLANASPAGDSLPVLAAANAIIVLQSHAETRRVAIDEFFLGYRKTAIRSDELIVAIEIPRIEGRQWFSKIGTRAAQAIAKVSAAGVRANEVRFALGAVAPTVIRAHQAEAAISATLPIEQVCTALQSDIAPIDDLRSTAAYRRHVAAVLLKRFLAETNS